MYYQRCSSNLSEISNTLHTFIFHLEIHKYIIVSLIIAMPTFYFEGQLEQKYRLYIAQIIAIKIHNNYH